MLGLRKQGLAWRASRKNGLGVAGRLKSVPARLNPGCSLSYHSLAVNVPLVIGFRFWAVQGCLFAAGSGISGREWSGEGCGLSESRLGV